MLHEAQQQAQALEIPAPSARADIGLTDREQTQRNALVAQWMQRIRTVMEETGCSAAAALRAIEASDAAQRTNNGEGTMDEATQEEVRTRFFNATRIGIDIHCLEPHDVRVLLDLLPQVLVALQAEYDLFEIYRNSDDDDVNDV